MSLCVRDRDEHRSDPHGRPWVAARPVAWPQTALCSEDSAGDKLAVVYPQASRLWLPPLDGRQGLPLPLWGAGLERWLNRPSRHSPGTCPAWHGHCGHVPVTRASALRSRPQKATHGTGGGFAVCHGTSPSREWFGGSASLAREKRRACFRGACVAPDACAEGLTGQRLHAEVASLAELSDVLNEGKPVTF